jgi:hypothetical protein
LLLMDQGDEKLVRRRVLRIATGAVGIGNN